MAGDTLHLRRMPVRKCFYFPQSPYHDQYTQVADEDNPILLVGEH